MTGAHGASGSSGHDTTARDRVLGRTGFAPDRFQIEAFDVIDRGHSVLVAAPTSSGKTLVAEYAIELALDRGERAFYTTPIKALSNQKLRDLTDIHGRDSVGLLTGDNVVRPDAPVVVMTTEVLRNMIYAESPALDRLGVVILDEIHYLMDRYRGPVWEEVIVQLDPGVSLVCLSATVSNADEVVGWLQSVRGPTEAVVEADRPVELRNRYLLGDKATGQLRVFDTLDARGRPNPKVARLLERGTGSTDRSHTRDRSTRDRGTRPGRGPRRIFAPRRPEVVIDLADSDLLPAIYFIFSRAGCDAAALACAERAVSLVAADVAAEIDAIVDRHLMAIDAPTAQALGVDAWRRLLRRGVAAHHAGLVPLMKEAVEEVFAAGLLQVVFATETLAMGVNLPARTVVIEALSKYRGDGHSLLTPGEYAQLTGRAGRRGIDEVGDAVVLWSPFVPFDQVAELVSSREFRLTSAFRPTWNMVANLVATTSPEGAHRVLGSSLAQFQADRTVVSLRRRLARVVGEQAALEAELSADLGDRFDTLRTEARASVAALRDTRSPGAGPGDEAARIDPGLGELDPGAVIVAPDGEPVAVLSTAHRGAGNVRLRVISARPSVRVLTAQDFDGPPEMLGHIELPTPYQPTRRTFQDAVARRLRSYPPARRRGPSRRQPLLDELAKPVMRSLRRLARLDDDRDRIEHRIHRSASDLVTAFDQLVEELTERHYVAGWTLTDRGRVLAGLYHESDLLVAECVVNRLLDGLGPPELAALVSCIVHEHRSPDPPSTPWFPSPQIAERFVTMSRMAIDIAEVEQRCGMPEAALPDAGFVSVAHGWALDVPLLDLLGGEDMSGGDFVRTMRQLIDLLRQLGHVAPRAVATNARIAANRLDRGLVAATRLDDAEPPDPEPIADAEPIAESGLDSRTSVADDVHR